MHSLHLYNITQTSYVPVYQHLERSFSYNEHHSFCIELEPLCLFHYRVKQWNMMPAYLVAHYLQVRDTMTPELTANSLDKHNIPGTLHFIKSFALYTSCNATYKNGFTYVKLYIHSPLWPTERWSGPRFNPRRADRYQHSVLRNLDTYRICKSYSRLESQRLGDLTSWPHVSSYIGWSKTCNRLVGLGLQWAAQCEHWYTKGREKNEYLIFQ